MLMISLHEEVLELLVWTTSWMLGAACAAADHFYSWSWFDNKPFHCMDSAPAYWNAQYHLWIRSVGPVFRSVSQTKNPWIFISFHVRITSLYVTPWFVGCGNWKVAVWHISIAARITVQCQILYNLFILALKLKWSRSISGGQCDHPGAEGKHRGVDPNQKPRYEDEAEDEVGL